MTDQKSEKKIYIAGHRGLVGSALHRTILKKGYRDPIVRTRQELNLLNRDEVRLFFEKEKPQWVFLSAAKVGGIIGNSTYPADFLLENLRIQNNVLEAARDFKVEKLLFLGSSCIYPKDCPQPIKEEYLLSSKLESTNEAYSLAKISGLKLADAMNRQYGTNFISVMPSNLYGLNDNYHPENAHALPMLLRRFHEAKESGKKKVVVWGTGKPMREFLFADDLAEACLFLMEKFNASELSEVINIGTGVDLAISELATLIKKVVGYQGEISYDHSRPDGTLRKVLDVSKLKALGWNAQTSLEEGLSKTYRDFVSNPSLRMG